MKKSLLALTLTFALSLVSCQVMRETTTTARTQYNRATQSAADSVGLTTTATHNAIRAQVDNLLQAALKQTYNHESEASVEQSLRLLIFDTTQPADTATGLPPVKAALAQTTATTRKDKTLGATTATVSTETTKAQTDSTMTLKQSKAHVQSEAQDSVVATSDTAEHGKTQRSSWRVWAVLFLVALSFIGVCVIYLRRKLKL